MNNTVKKILIIFAICTAFLNFDLIIVRPVFAQEQKVEIEAYVIQRLQELDAKLLDFSTTKNQYEIPNVTFNIILRNTGKDYFIPQGVLNIKNDSGVIITVINLNTDRIILQPQQIYQFQVNWNKNGLDIGNYQTDLEIYYGNQKTIQSSVNFKVAPIKTTGSVLVLMYLASYGYIYIHNHFATLLVTGKSNP